MKTIMKPMISLIAAVSENNVIGKDNQLLWYLPADLKYFKQQTVGKPVIMGRKTFESILKSLGRPLPHRKNIVLTRDERFFYEGVFSSKHLSEAIQLAGDVPEVMIIGGGSVYEQALPIADTIYLTRIHHTFKGDTFFPSLNPQQWKVIDEQKHLADEKNSYPYTFFIYGKKGGRIPGPNSRKIVAELAKYESPAITARQLARAEAGGVECPIVWAKTSDVWVEDVDGNRFLDFTAGFGVASVGHANSKIIEAAKEQMDEMPHAMGDAFPGKNKAVLLKRLSDITPGNLQRTFLTNSGSESVEAALKTAMIKTDKAGIIAFEDAYHGLSYGALAVTSYRDRFREPFLSQLNPHIYRLPYPTNKITGTDFKEQIEKTIQRAGKDGSPIGAIIIEPILGRGGIVEAPVEHLQTLRELTLEHHIVFIIDEIYTGFGRTGTMFAIEQANIVPDLLCMGKGMNGGFPISAVIGTDDVMSGWGDAKGEALHTSTFLGNPVGCAMVLACIDELEGGILEHGNMMGQYFKTQLIALKNQIPSITEIRGKGLMLGVEFRHPNKNYILILCKELLQRGFIALPCGLEANVLGLTPPLTIRKDHIDNLIRELKILCNP